MHSLAVLRPVDWVQAEHIYISVERKEKDVLEWWPWRDGET